MNRTIASMVFLGLAQTATLAQPSVEVLRPSSGDRLQRGTTFRIEWRTQGLGTNIDWSISLYTNNVRVGSLSSPRIYDGAGNWHSDFTVTSDWPSDCDYHLNVNDDGSEANDDSELFCLGVPALAMSGALSQGKAEIRVEGVFSHGICTFEHADVLTQPWLPIKNFFTLSNTLQSAFALNQESGFFRAVSRNLSADRAGFTNVIRSYGRLTTVAGAGGLQDVNNWRPEFEGALATQVFLSGPHIAQANLAGEIYIADKDSHAIRKVRLDGRIVTVAGINAPGNGSDEAQPGTSCALSGPNGVWVRTDGTVYILDTGNGKVRRLETNGTIQTLFAVPGGVLVGRGLWVSDDQTLAYLCSLTAVKRWTAAGGVTDFSVGFTELGNIVLDSSANVIVTDRGTHRVYRLDAQGVSTVIGGNGSTLGGGDGQLATSTALNEVRALWPVPTGGFLVGTHRGSQLWYIDTAGYIHLLLNGNRNGAHAGDGTWFYNPAQARVSEIRGVTMDHQGNLLITENDIGFVRKIEFLPFTP